MNYTNLLTKHSIEPKQLSPALKRLVSQHGEVEAEIAKGEEKLQSGKLTDNRKQKLEQDLEEARETLNEINETLCTGIDNWLANRGKNLAKGQALKAARDAKKNATGSSTPAGSGAATPAATASTQTPAATTPAAASTPATTPASSAAVDNSGQQTPEKKKSSSGWVIPTIFISLVLFISGVAYHNHQKNSI